MFISFKVLTPLTGLSIIKFSVDLTIALNYLYGSAGRIPIDVRALSRLPSASERAKVHSIGGGGHEIPYLDRHLLIPRSFPVLED